MFTSLFPQPLKCCTLLCSSETPLKICLSSLTPLSPPPLPTRVVDSGKCKSHLPQLVLCILSAAGGTLSTFLRQQNEILPMHLQNLPLLTPKLIPELYSFWLSANINKPSQISLQHPPAPTGSYSKAKGGFFKSME